MLETDTALLRTKCAGDFPANALVLELREALKLLAPTARRSIDGLPICSRSPSTWDFKFRQSWLCFLEIAQLQILQTIILFAESNRLVRFKPCWTYSQALYPLGFEPLGNTVLIIPRHFGTDRFKLSQAKSYSSLVISFPFASE